MNENVTIGRVIRWMNQHWIAGMTVGIPIRLMSRQTLSDDLRTVVDREHVTRKALEAIGTPEAKTSVTTHATKSGSRLMALDPMMTRSRHRVLADREQPTSHRCQIL